MRGPAAGPPTFGGDMSTNNAINTSIPYKFSTYLINVISNVTGDSSKYHVVCDTIICNYNGAYSTETGNFTAPIAGMWLLGGNMTWGQCKADNTQFNVSLHENNSGGLQLYRYTKTASGNTYTSDHASWSTIIFLSTSEVVALYTEVDGHSTKNITLFGGSPSYINWYGVYLGV